MTSSKNSKIKFNPLSNISNNSSMLMNMITNPNNEDPLQDNTNKKTATLIPNILANLTTGMDVFPIDRDKLINAPESWNFYSRLEESKMTELIESIEDKGLLHPIVVWQQPDDTYMILSGHNRNAAYQYLYNYYKDYTQKAEKYKTIHAHIFKYEELDEEDAKQIIIDTNWVQRQLSVIEKQKSIFNKYTSLGRKQKAKNGEGVGEDLRGFIGKNYNLSGRQVSKYIKLNYLISELQDMISNKEININSGVRLADFSVEIQQWIYDKFKDRINNKIISKLKTNMDQEKIESIFNLKEELIDNNDCFKTKNMSIPTKLKDDYIKIMFKFYKEHYLIPENISMSDFSSRIIES